MYHLELGKKINSKGNKTISALSLDHSGGRLITGGRDHEICVWDFHRMDKRLKYIKTFEPVEGNAVYLHILFCGFKFL
jgi:WD40 repeat protein